MIRSSCPEWLFGRHVWWYVRLLLTAAALNDQNISPLFEINVLENVRYKAIIYG